MNSQFFQAVANLLRHIEGLGVPSDQYGVLDAGQTLELSKALHEQIKDVPEFRTFESVGGSWYCFDEFDEWVVVEPGVTAAMIADLFDPSTPFGIAQGESLRVNVERSRDVEVS